MTIGDRYIGHVGGQGGSGRNRIAAWRSVSTEAAPSDLRRVERRDGIKRQSEQVGINATEALVYDVLDDELVSAKEIAGFAGIPVAECRRALATLRTLGMADAERRGNVHGWRRA